MLVQSFINEYNNDAVGYYNSLIRRFNAAEKFRHITRKPIRTSDMSFESSRRAESNDTKISFGTQLGAEI
uniref:Uncharacterized protein n=1 Tax=Meloidogyne incognita TaxID=6306 RepID=A0A914L6S8_MELIC